MNNNNSSISQRYKLLNPCRNQVEMQFKSIDEIIPSNHKARVIWEFVEKMDLTACFGEILSFKNAAGRPTTSPKVLLCLWIYSILQGNISARKIEEFCKYHDVYKWIVGGTPINRTMISEFRSLHPEKFEELLVSCLAVMVKNNLISDQDFAQDGTRVKASAGFNTFRSEEKLEILKEEISVRIKELDEELLKDPNAFDARSKSTKLRNALIRAENIDKALINLKEQKKSDSKNTTEDKKKSDLENTNEEHATKDELKKTRASFIDPGVRKMKMGDSGYRLAYNVQFATGITSRVIFSTDVVTTLDPGTSPGMMTKVHRTLNRLNMSKAKTWNADAAYSAKSDLEAANRLFPNCKYYSPAKLKKGLDPKKVQKNDSEVVIKWRESLETEEMKKTYSKRCSTAEFSNAQTKNQGMGKVLVRGINKVMGMINLHAISHNISRFMNLSKKMVQTT